MENHIQDNQIGFKVSRESWVEGPFYILVSAIQEKKGEETLDFSNNFFTLRSYDWGAENDELFEPNFEIPSENFELDWYKYPFRNSYASEELTPKRWNVLIQKCIESLEEDNQ